MKTLYTFVSLIFIATLAQAQLPNASFEHWTNGTPTGWYSTAPAAVVQSTNAHDSTYAVRFNVLELNTITYSGNLYSGDSGTDAFVPIPSVPAALNGWFIGNFVDSDEMAVNGNVSVNGLYVGQLGVTFLENTTVYKQFSFSFDTLNVPAGGADSIYIEFGLINQSEEGAGALDTSTYYIIDDLSLGPVLNVAGINQVNANAILEQCSPNPASNVANIIYSIAGHSTVTLTLYDVVGHKLMTLLDNLQQTPGRYKVPTDVSELANGVYLYNLNVDGQSYTHKLVVSK